MPDSTPLAAPPEQGMNRRAPAVGGARITGGARAHRSGPGPDVMASSSLEGESVLDAAGEKLGEIEEIMLDVRSGNIAYAVLAVGGFLGIGEKYFAVPWRALTLDADRECFVLDVDRDRLADAPGFDKDHWPSTADESWAGESRLCEGRER